MPRPHPLSPLYRNHIITLVDRLNREEVEVRLLPLVQSRHDYADVQSAEASVASQISHVLRHPEHCFVQRWHVAFEALIRENPIPAEPEVVEDPPQTTLVRFEYQGHAIFGNTMGGLVNLNDMWRAIGSPPNKEPNQWARSKAVQSFIRYVASRTPNPSANSQTANSQSEAISHVYVIVSGGHHPGTWAHWQIALRYAQYLSNEFAYWGNTAIRDRLEGRDSLGPHELQGILQHALEAQNATLCAIQRTLEVVLSQSARLLQGSQPEAPVAQDPASRIVPGARSQVKTICEAQARLLMKQEGLSHDKAYESAFSYLYNCAESRWKRNLQRPNGRKSTLDYIERLGLLDDLLALAKEIYPVAYAECRHRIEQPIILPIEDPGPPTQQSNRTPTSDLDSTMDDIIDGLVP